MKKAKVKSKLEGEPPVRWIPVLDIRSLAAIKTREEIIEIIAASKTEAATRKLPRLIPVFSSEEAAKIRCASDFPPDAPSQPAK